MALRGTLGDFGIADIFQLVGHQTKTGVLVLKNRDAEVRISFIEGSVVKAEQPARDRSDLLGTMMMRAGAITQAQLDDALALQTRTLRRIGDILVETGALNRPTLREFARLQLTETIYALFLWRAGTYEFTAEDVEYDEQTYEPIRAENLLMEGFRMVDEWPAIQRVLPSMSCTFSTLRPLPAPRERARDDEDLLAGMNELLREQDANAPEAKPPPTISEQDRKVYGLVAPGRTAQEIVDSSRIGEFETCKALANLAAAQLIKVHLPKGHRAKERAPRVPLKDRLHVALPYATRLVLYAVVAGTVGGAVSLGEAAGAGLLVTDKGLRVHTHATADALGEVMRGRLARQIEVYRLTQGKYPVALEDLVNAGFVEERELSFPYEERFVYEPRAQSFVLALPLR